MNIKIVRRSVYLKSCGFTNNKRIRCVCVYNNKCLILPCYRVSIQQQRSNNVASPLGRKRGGELGIQILPWV